MDSYSSPYPFQDFSSHTPASSDSLSASHPNSIVLGLGHAAVQNSPAPAMPGKGRNLMRRLVLRQMDGEAVRSRDVGRVGHESCVDSQM